MGGITSEKDKLEGCDINVCRNDALNYAIVVVMRISLRNIQNIIEIRLSNYLAVNLSENGKPRWMSGSPAIN